MFTLVMSLAFTSVYAQSVSGTVSDNQGPLIGATVAEKGTGNGTVTDMNGNFKLNVKAGATLVISYVGMNTQEIKVGSKKTFNIVMMEDAKSLEDLVVIGYGVQKKSDLTGSVASVKSADLMNRSTTDAAAALQGKVAGVQILNSSGAPGEGAQIRVRGYSSNSGNLSPLLIVDGLKVDNIQYLDPSMIESMEVLKDAASAAIYGAEAGNGVVLITTKTGKSGHSSITYDMKFTNNRLGKKAELFDGPGYLEYEQYIGAITEDDLKRNGYVPGTYYNWFDAVFEPSWAQQHSLTFQGGNDKGHYLAAINYVKNNGIIKGDKDTYKRLTGQINADYQIKKWLKVGTTNSIEKWSTKSVSQRSYGSMLNSVMSLDPLTPALSSDINQLSSAQQSNIDRVPMTPDGQYYVASKYLEEATGNPLWQRDRTDGTNEGWNVRGSAYLNFTPIEGLVYTSRIGYRINQSNSHSYSVPYYLTPLSSDVNYAISAGNNTGYYYQWENFINYTKTIADKHNIGAMVGMSWTENHNDNMSISANGADILKGYAENYHYIGFLKDDVKPQVGNTPGDLRSLAYYGRVSYNFDERYFLQFNFRSDAYDSSKLHKDKRWGFFPSISAGWTISNEKFFKDAFTPETISFLKIRGSWGKNGNVNVLNNYQYSSSVNLNTQWYQYNVEAPTQYFGTAPEDKLANPDLTWETSNQVDVGLEARFLNNRLSFGMDFYNKVTKDLLLQYTPNEITGYKSSYMNAGEVLNRGWEFELGWKDNINDFQYSINANLSTLKNEVRKLAPQVTFIKGTGGGVSGLNYKISTYCEEGQPLWFFRGFDYVGVNPETGKPIYTDKDGNLTENVLDGDLKYIGSAIPKVTYGLTINLAYKGFDFSLYGTGAAGGKIFSLLYSADRIKTNTLRTYYENSWKNPGDNAKYPDLTSAKTDWNFWSSSASMFSGNYFKIKQIQLGYTLPKNIINKAYIENLRLFVSLDDFFTITSYPGCDPETALGYGSAGLQDSGYDSGVYPTSKKIMLGMSVTF